MGGRSSTCCGNAPWQPETRLTKPWGEPIVVTVFSPRLSCLLVALTEKTSSSEAEKYGKPYALSGIFAFGFVRWSGAVSVCYYRILRTIGSEEESP